MSEQGYEAALAVAREGFRAEHAEELAEQARRRGADEEWREFLAWFAGRARALPDGRWRQVRLRVRTSIRGRTYYDEDVSGYGLGWPLEGYEYGEPSLRHSLLTDDLVLWPLDPTGVPEDLVAQAKQAGTIRFDDDEPVVALPLHAMTDQEQRERMRGGLIQMLARHTEWPLAAGDPPL